MAGCYVVFHKQLGDLVLLEPALSKLREKHGDPIRLITRSGHADLVEIMPGVVHTAGFAWSPKRDLYCFDPLRKSAVKSLLAPVLHRSLIPPDREELAWFHPLIFSSISKPELGNAYVARFFWDHTPGVATSVFAPPRLDQPPSEWASAVPPHYTLVSPTSGWSRKSWTAAGWADVLAGLPGPFVLTSGRTEWQVATCREIRERVGDKVSIMAGTRLRDFLWLISHARAVLTVDGAASHLAAAFGVPCLTLFGISHLENWHLPQHKHVALRPPADADGRHVLKNLVPEVVLAEAQKILG